MHQTSKMCFRVTAPVEAAYEYFADLRHVPDYDPPVRSIQPTPPQGWDGSSFSMVFAPLGPWPKIPLTLAVEGCDPGRTLTYRIDGPRMSARDHITFQFLGAYTEVTITATFELRGPLAPAMFVYRALLPVMRRVRSRSTARAVTEAYWGVGAEPHP
jgi:hypothetical protein